MYHARHVFNLMPTCLPCAGRAPTMADTCACLPVLPLRPPRVGTKAQLTRPHSLYPPFTLPHSLALARAGRGRVHHGRIDRAPPHHYSLPLAFLHLSRQRYRTPRTLPRLPNPFPSTAAAPALKSSGHPAPTAMALRPGNSGPS